MSEDARPSSGSSDGDGVPSEADGREEAVRRLLADARHTAPAPQDVVASLDAALDAERAALAAGADTDRDTGGEGRRAAARDVGRRRWPTVVAAAAAVVLVAGLGAGALGLVGDLAGLGEESGDDPASSTALGDPTPGDPAPGDPTPSPGDEGPQTQARPDDGTEGGSDDFSAESEPRTGPERRDLPTVRSGATLVDDVTAVLRAPRPQPSGDTRRCAPGSAAGQVVPVLLDGARADLVARPADAGERRVRIVPCGPEADRTVTVPVG